MKEIFNDFMQAVLEAMDTFSIAITSIAIYLMMAFGYDQSVAVIERNPGALLAVIIFVAVWSFTIVLIGLLVQALKKLKVNYDKPQVKQ